MRFWLAEPADLGLAVGVVDERRLRQMRLFGVGIGVAAYATPTSATSARKPTPARAEQLLERGTQRRTPSYASRG